MVVNSRILQIFTQYGINHEDGLTYLLTLYYNLKPSYIPDLLKRKVLASKIIELDSKQGTIWNVPLFEEQLTNFEWVKDYREVFKKANPDRAGSLKTCIARFKRFFAENPDVRLDEVKGAVNMYFKSLKNPEYVITSHYFIYKGKGVDEVSELQTWIERFREAQHIASARISNSNTMQ